MPRRALVCLALLAALLLGPDSGAGQVADPPFTALLPPSFNSPEAVVSDRAGNLWFAEAAAGRIGRLTRQGEITHFNLPQLSNRIESLVLGPDGAIWFAASSLSRPGRDYVGRITAEGRIDRYELLGVSLTLGALTAGVDNDLWLLDNDGAIHRIGIDGSITRKYQVHATASSIVLGPDGNLWVGGGGRIARVVPTGEVAEFPLSNKDWEVYTLIAGPENTLWFVAARFLSNLRVVGRITMAGGITEYPITAPGLVAVGDLASDPTGNIWLTLVGTNLLGKLSPSGTLTTIELPLAMQATVEELADGRRRSFLDTEHLARGADGGLWFTRGWYQPEQIGYRANDGAMTVYPTPPPLTPLDLAIGPDSAVWFTEGADWYFSGATRIGRLAADGTAAIVHDSGAQGQTLKFGGMVAGPDGNLWAIAAVTTATRGEPSGLVLRIAPSGQITGRFVVEESGTITAGPDGALWFTQDDFAHRIGRITTDGQVSYVTLPNRNLNSTHIATGPDGNLWVTGHSGYNGELWRVTPSGNVTTFTLPKEVFLPLSIIAGPDGNVWFAADMTINRITPDGQITSFKLPGYRPPLYDYIVEDYVPRGLAVGPDGNLWFTRYSYYDTPSSLGRITMAGGITEFPLPAGGSHPGAIVSGADGMLYVSARGIRQLIRVDIGALTGVAPAPTPSASPSQPPATPTELPPSTPLPSATATPPPLPGMPNTGNGNPPGQGQSVVGLLLAVILLLVALGWQRGYLRWR